jgi:uncharacterized protein
LTRYFFDTSAIVKYYHVEIGTAAVMRIYAEPDRKIAISTLGFVEIQAAFATKVRSGVIDKAAAALLSARFHLDVSAGDVEVYPLQGLHFEIAELLIGRHSFVRHLRTLDALQLAVALALSREKVLDRFVVSDEALAEIARMEGLTVINPKIA